MLRPTCAACAGTRIGTGQIGQCVRFELELAGDCGDAPRSLVGKFPSHHRHQPADRRPAGKLLEGGLLYRELQPRLGIRTPRCYYARIEGRGPEHALLLEDLAPAAQGDQLRGCAARGGAPRAAVLELVGLHIRADLGAIARCARLEWLGAPDASTVQIGRTLYQAQLPAFLARFRDRLAADEVAIIERVAASAGPPFEPLGDVFAAVHIDYRLDNLLIDESHAPPRIAVVDWQSVTLGNPLADWSPQPSWGCAGCLHERGGRARARRRLSSRSRRRRGVRGYANCQAPLGV